MEGEFLFYSYTSRAGGKILRSSRNIIVVPRYLKGRVRFCIVIFPTIYNIQYWWNTGYIIYRLPGIICYSSAVHHSHIILYYLVLLAYTRWPRAAFGRRSQKFFTWKRGMVFFLRWRLLLLLLLFLYNYYSYCRRRESRGIHTHYIIIIIFILTFRQNNNRNIAGRTALGGDV